MDIMDTSDVLTLVLSLLWQVLVAFPDYRKNLLFTMHYTSLAILTTLASKFLPEFAPGLLDVLRSPSAPDIDFFRNLPQLSKEDAGRAYGVYALVLEKVGFLPGVYVGSAANSSGGVHSRWGTYRRLDRSTMPFYVQDYLEDGFEITHMGLLCWHVFPTSGDRPMARLLMVALEALFTYCFWAYNSTNSRFQHLCCWPTESLPWVGLCSHSALIDPVVGNFNLTPRQAEEQARLRARTERARASEANRANRTKVKADPKKLEEQKAYMREYHKRLTPAQKALYKKYNDEWRKRPEVKAKRSAQSAVRRSKPEYKAKASNHQKKAIVQARRTYMQRMRRNGIKPTDLETWKAEYAQSARKSDIANSFTPTTGTLPAESPASREPTPDLLNSTATDSELTEDELAPGDLDLPRRRQVTRRQPTYSLPESATDTDTDTDTDLLGATELSDLDLPTHVPKVTQTYSDVAMSEESQEFVHSDAYDAPTRNASQAVEIVDLSGYDTTAVPPRRAGAPVLHDREISDSEEDFIMGDLADENSTDNPTSALGRGTFGATAVLPSRASVLQNHEIIEISDDEDCIMSDMANDETTGDLQEVYDYLDHSSDEDYLGGESSDSDGE